MAASGNLATLTALKLWLGITNANSDAVLTSLLAAVSRGMLTGMNRDTLLQHVSTDVYDGVGYGQGRIVLREWPVLSVSAVSICGTPVAESPAWGQAGWTINPAWNGRPPGAMQTLDFSAAVIPAGRGNVSVTYTAGYVVSAEAWTIPATPYTITPTQPYGPWAADIGVTLANGTALTKVTGTPSAGQYAVSDAGVYTFAAADTGAAVLISYSFTPYDLSQACLEVCAERYAYKDRAGVSSKTLGGQETISYSLASMPKSARDVLDQYRLVVPV